MGFDVGKFVNNASKSIANRAVTQVKNTSESAIGGQGYVDLATSVLSSGASIQTIKSIASLKFDQFLDKTADDFFSRLKGSITGQGKGRVPTGSSNTSAIGESVGASNSMYPHDLGEYRIALQFAKYKRPLPLSRAITEITHTIYLPLPRELHSGHQMELATPQTGMIGSLVDAAFLANENSAVTAGTAASAAVPGAAAATGVAASRAGILGQVGKMAAVGAASESISAMVEQTIGATPNPNLSVSYKGPQLRTFNFTWEFAPTNAKESVTLQKILEDIQMRSLAAYSVEGSSAILSYPNTVTPKVYPNKKGAIGDLLKFKRSMISNIVIDTAPQGKAFFKGTKAPVFINLAISIQEIEYFVASDYGGSNNAGFATEIEQAFKDLTNGTVTMAGEVAGGIPGLDSISGIFDVAPENPPEESAS